ncbi:hypothetical protein SLEP1_g36849 [Rubroshorea leprosula]|uniref:CCHC-type domain-containing protein n=1 Tax=Rubroshorea leprosula TaxID=152421 RepID=A0AAV5KTA0_9ROSI|nr:hypothetical protein SLEP1_g36849 [Rubroshorea leprosula]
MAQFQAPQPLEGLSTTRPPFFDGTNYNYWKNRMKIFMLANVPKAWIVTMKGPYVPMKVVGEREVPKEEVEWNDEDLGKIMINNKAINMLQCALNPTEFHRVSGCDTAKEMWDMLEMKPEESIHNMYTRLNDIVTNLKALGKVYPSQEVVRKVLRSLPKNWEAKKIAIEESKDLNTLKLEDLIGKLMTYEIEVQVDDGVEVVEKKKKKDVAFKASNQKEKSEDDASDGENISTLISREVRRFMKKNTKSKLAKRDEGESTKRSVKCYKCNKMGHYRNECPNLKKGEKKSKKSMKKKDFAATWSDDETSSTESESSLEKGVANLCFMTQEDSNHDEEVNSNFSSSINESSFEYSYDDLCKVLDCSMNDIKKLGNENIVLTKTISLLRNEIESLSKQNEVLVKENASLNGEIASLKNEESNNALKKENEDLKNENEDLKKENEGHFAYVCPLKKLIAQGAEAKGNRLGVLVPVAKPRKKQKRLNLGRFIYHNIIKNYYSDMGFPHGALITRLVKRNNIDLESFKHGKIKVGTTLTQASFEKMQIVFRNGDWKKRGDQGMGQQSDEEKGDADQEMAEQGEEEHGGDSRRTWREPALEAAAGSIGKDLKPAVEESRMCRKPAKLAAEMVSRLYRAGSRKVSRLSCQSCNLSFASYRAFNDFQRLEMAIFEQGAINMVGNRFEEV